MDEKTISEGKSLAWLSYFGILLIIPLLVNKDNDYSKFHVKQGIVLMICSVVTYFLGLSMNFIPLIGVLLYFSLSLFLLVLMIMGVVNALTGKMEPLPLIGQFAEKFNI